MLIALWELELDLWLVGDETGTLLLAPLQWLRDNPGAEWGTDGYLACADFVSGQSPRPWVRIWPYLVNMCWLVYLGFDTLPPRYLRYADLPPVKVRELPPAILKWRYLRAEWLLPAEPLHGRLGRFRARPLDSSSTGVLT